MTTEPEIPAAEGIEDNRFFKIFFRSVNTIDQRQKVLVDEFATNADTRVLQYDLNAFMDFLRGQLREMEYETKTILDADKMTKAEALDEMLEDNKGMLKISQSLYSAYAEAKVQACKRADVLIKDCPDQEPLLEVAVRLIALARCERDIYGFIIERQQRRENLNVDKWNLERQPPKKAAAPQRNPHHGA
jgi:hypothetical protein